MNHSAGGMAGGMVSDFAAVLVLQVNVSRSYYQASSGHGASRGMCFQHSRFRSDDFVSTLLLFTTSTKTRPWCISYSAPSDMFDPRGCDYISSALAPWSYNLCKSRIMPRSLYGRDSRLNIKYPLCTPKRSQTCTGDRSKE